MTYGKGMYFYRIECWFISYELNMQQKVNTVQSNTDIFLHLILGAQLLYERVCPSLTHNLTELVFFLLYIIQNNGYRTFFVHRKMFPMHKLYLAFNASLVSHSLS